MLPVTITSIDILLFEVIVTGSISFAVFAMVLCSGLQFCPKKGAKGEPVDWNTRK